MKMIKKTRPATWLTGGAVALSASAADAAVVVHVMSHDLTSSLDGLPIFPGGVTDAGQWVLGGSIFSRRGGGGAYFLIDTVDSAFIFNRVGNNGYARLGAGSGFTSVGVGGLGVGDSIRGYAAWDLSDGTEGWLRIVGTRVSDAANVDPALFPTLVATGFVYDDADAMVRPGFADVEAAGGDKGIFTSIPEPSSLILLAAGAGGVMLRRRRKSAA
jgi:hypothetical protein